MTNDNDGPWIHVTYTKPVTTNFIVHTQATMYDTLYDTLYLVTEYYRNDEVTPYYIDYARADEFKG